MRDANDCAALTKRHGSDSSFVPRLGSPRCAAILGMLAAVVGCSAADEAGWDSEESSAVSAPVTPITPSTGKRSFIHFESGPVRPIALSPDGTKLFVTNIPDGRL